MAHVARPQVVLMDVTMPILNGIEAARLLNASPSTSDVKVIGYTAKPDFWEGPLKRLLFVDVLKKPTSPELLISTVQRQFAAA